MGSPAGVGDGEVTWESMPFGLITLDTDWRVRYVNAAAEASVGLTRGQLVGRWFWEAFPANEVSDFGRAYREAVASGRPRTVEARADARS